MTRTLDIWWEGRRVGQLTQDKHGELGFAYAPAWIDDEAAQPLSASLPKRAEPFTRRECRPFFGGLLPEEGQRDAAAQVLGVSRANDFALLDRLGGDVAGALQLLPPGEPPPALTLDRQATPLDDAGLIRVLDALPVRPLLAGEEGLRLSLAGAQSKAPVVLVDGAVALPAPGQPTTHILKPPISRLEATTENEAFVMRLAAAVGLDVAPVEPRIVRDRRFLLVQRYDRALGDDGRVRRIHQEDFCQALGVPPETKYASEGGPTFKDCFALLRRVAARPAVDVLKLLDAVIFNVIAGNADAHGKNFSILYDAEGPRLAPLYDLLATVAYPELSPSFAMRIGNRATLAELDAAAWAAFAADAGLGVPLVRRRVAEISKGVVEKATTVASELSRLGLNPTALEQFADMIRERARWLAGT
ncbi:MAG: type II toxin-antitoxin system HipA family toxin [Phenylobacterium sp.]|uniref:type II toxin-antitoxin system HipA family toxin n=1 Tax=Phenylobacterium sp. TaxID=1871053 RepID=UPI0025F28AAB|nr:type II toxin-antitoxin system HipA family toxin [Phenylobacterium sp.]MCA6224744.1 type II toxin-antitoxin system HipA family toxin [Phenylobacterium sp.]MCA6226553.1 type II toxin-antitoxin system HipA family toxin [Phenylobacterium sp.]MCA6233297.1 type II toxin-antitoxin system HipA family toxin [Phenylobacterium sp.]MCA6235966.1 type II toxin-antitoxin system HipA family toxin [Phenylobacterium sp.]MCA6248487.1 type II toxin-antitoxin system HipA family toxin [Phenylobacterium sp.]